MKNKKKLIYLRWLAFLMMVFPAVSYAADIFSPVSGDKLMIILNAMFGGASSGSGSGSDAFGAVMANFNGAILAVGGVLAAYTILAGTLGTAHDGEMLGKKFSSVWIPIRYMLGTALVLPVIAMKYCLMQGIVLWLVTQGIGLADQTWSTYVSSTNLAQEQAQNYPNADYSSLVNTLFQSEVCLASLQASATGDWSGKLLAPGATFGVTTTTTPTSVIEYFGSTNSVADLAYDSCGKVEVSNIPSVAATPNSSDTAAASPLIMSSSVNDAMQQVYTAQKTELDTALASLAPLAAQLVSTGQPVSAQSLIAVANTWQSDIKAKSQAAMAQTQPFQQIAKNAASDGYIFAGAWFMPIAAVNNKMGNAINAVPTASGPANLNDMIFKDQLAAVQSAVQKSIESTGKSGQLVFGVGNTDGGSNDSWGNVVKGIISGHLDPSTIVKKFFTSAFGGYTLAGNSNLVVSDSTMGGWLLSISSAAWAACMVAMATIGNMPGVGMAVVGTMLLVLPPLILVGVTLTYILPFMPFALWLGGVIGFIVLVIEAMIMAPLWAVLHLHPQGDDLSGKGANGYPIIMSLLLRPVLQVFGLIAAITMINVVGPMLNATFADVFALSQSDSGFITWIVGVIVGPFLYAGLSYQFIKTACSLFTLIPDQVERWIGGPNATAMGTHAEGMGGQGSSTYVAAAAVARIGGAAAEKLGAPKAQKGGSGGDGEMAPASLVSKNDERLGAGANDIKSMAQAQHGGAPAESLKVQQTLSAVNQAKSIAGSRGENFISNLESKHSQAVASNPSASLEDSIPSAMNDTLNDQYGRGTGAISARVGGGYSGAKFADAVHMYRETAQRLGKNMNPAQVRDAIQDANRNIIKEYRDSKGQADVGSLMKNTLNNLG